MMTHPRKDHGLYFLRSWASNRTSDPTARLFVSILRECFFDDANFLWLISLSLLVLLASSWLMLSPGIIYSAEMTWDLLFNLDGAWRLYEGQVSHVDFENVFGTLTFAMTTLGFQLIGIKPIAFIVGECILATVLTLFAIVVVKDRLPILPGLLFVSLCATLVLMPGINGEDPSRLTFAMSYNRFGWSAVSILYLLLFIEPRGTRNPVWTDLGVGSFLTIGLFYLKITYFAAAVAAICLALLTSRHVRRHWPHWSGMLLLAIVVAFAPINEAYRADLLSAIASGRAHSNLFPLIREFASNGMEQIWVFVQIMILICLITHKYATFSDVLVGLFIWTTGFFLLTQNAQGPSVPLYLVLALLLYVRLGNWLQSPTAGYSLMLRSCLMICALLPLLLPLFSNCITLVLYNHRARLSAEEFVVTTTNLKGLAVREDKDDIFDEVAANRYTRDSFSRIRVWPRFLELTQHEYIKTVLALADFVQEKGIAAARIAIVDQVNPLPFVLGVTPPRGGNLWSGNGISWQPPEKAFRDSDYVAIPRFPTDRATLIDGLKVYGGYLSSQFVERYETPYWTLLERRG